MQFHPGRNAMSDSFFTFSNTGRESRRAFLKQSAMLSGTAIALLAGHDALASSVKSAGSGSADVGILNTALGPDPEPIAAYQGGAESGLLQKSGRELAEHFPGPHTATPKESTSGGRGKNGS